jgi:Protein of unknown function (DUF2934)
MEQCRLQNRCWQPKMQPLRATPEHKGALPYGTGNNPTSAATETRSPEAQMREQITALAYDLWQHRGCPEGTPETDWFRAKQELLAQAAELSQRMSMAA